MWSKSVPDISTDFDHRSDFGCLFKNMNSPSTGHACGNQFTQIVCICFRVKQSAAQERNQLIKLLTRQPDWRRKQGIDARQNWLNRSSWSLEVSRDTRADRLVTPRRTDCNPGGNAQRLRAW